MIAQMVLFPLGRVLDGIGPVVGVSVVRVCQDYLRFTAGDAVPMAWIIVRRTVAARVRAPASGGLLQPHRPRSAFAARFQLTPLFLCE